MRILKIILLLLTWYLNVNSSDLSIPEPKYIYVGEFDGVKIYHSENLKKSYTDMIEKNLNKSTHYEYIDLFRKKD